MKYLQFTLSMPGKGSWNGKWSGEGNLYAKVRKFSSSKKNQANPFLKEDTYSFSWPDGWRASVNVKEIDSATARKVNKASRGFCGYDWMIDSILSKGYITAD